MLDLLKKKLKETEEDRKKEKSQEQAFTKSIVEKSNPEDLEMKKKALEEMRKKRNMGIFE
jgi:hypothetical protein